MILWSQRAAAALSGIFLMALLFPIGGQWEGSAGATVNLAFVLAEKFPSSLRRFLPPFVLAFNTVFSAYGVLAGGPVLWAVLAACSSLFSWNASLFLHRWPFAPLPVRRRYLWRIGGLLMLGLGAGISALALQGRISCPFAGVLLFALVAGALYLYMVGGAPGKAVKS